MPGHRRNDRKIIITPWVANTSLSYVFETSTPFRGLLEHEYGLNPHTAVGDQLFVPVRSLSEVYDAQSNNNYEFMVHLQDPHANQLTDKTTVNRVIDTTVQAICELQEWNIDDVESLFAEDISYEVRQRLS